MKVGDLVSLSAYGTVREYNSRLIKPKSTTELRPVGIIVSVNLSYTYSYLVQWCHNTGKPHNRWTHCRREIKYVR